MLKKAVLISIMIISLVGCTTTINYKGESTSWRGNYSATINSKNNREQGTYEFVYIGNIRIDTIQKAIIKNGSRTTEITDFSLLDGKMQIPTSCSGCSNKNNPIEVTIWWNDTEETFELIYR
ncbi:hypothetical protein [Paenibacillus aceti]|uniref:Lipoprotein n=1 Tax=Paenibacillus aceti TaxID=1820010 RepID=A0ABQ1W6P2_9BACL|nr:hypothetical protein [Paenibacillus aceti]GGG15497.1 hypothetical protein GCM10010913_41780 [Paenibacillus aceti]